MKDSATQRDTNTSNIQLQGGNLFNETADTIPQGGNSFNRNRGKKVGMWNKTGKENLVRHKSGRYYARVSGGGKEVWKSLKTSHLQAVQAGCVPQRASAACREWWW